MERTGRNYKYRKKKRHREAKRERNGWGSRNMEGGEDRNGSNLFIHSMSGGKGKVEKVGGEKKGLILVKGEMMGVEATFMADCGASNNFISQDMVDRRKMDLQPNDCYVLLADGTANKSKGDVVGGYHLWTEGGGPEPAGKSNGGFASEDRFVATPLKKGTCDVILGLPWLRRHNPTIDWKEGTIKFQEEGGTIRWDGPLGKVPRLYTMMTTLGAGEQPAVPNLYSMLATSLILNALITNSKATSVARTAIHTQGDRRFKDLIRQYQQVFPSDLPAGLPPVRGGVEHTIELVKGSAPRGRPIYRMSPAELEELKKQLDDMLKKGFISPSKSPYAAPVMLVPKADGTKRLVVDFRKLNEDTIKNRYALPLVDELFDQVQGAQYFSKIDLRTGFYQIPLKEEDRSKTGFNTRYGLYQYNVLPMGLTNAPATFMHLMNHTFRDFLDEFVLVFLDDIIIYSKNANDHLLHVRQVLQRLKDHKLYAKLSKCTFFQTEVEFLGHRLGAEGLKVMPEKVTSVASWPTPTSVKEVRSFLGLAGYYRRFVKQFSKIASPLTELTKDRVKFRWGKEEQEAMDRLKESLSAAPVLVLPDPKLPFVLTTDASGYATGAVLQQDHGKGMQPIGFLSRKLGKAELNWATHEQELLAIMHATAHWRHLLSGKKFTVETDHNSLRFFMTQPSLTGRQIRWQQKLAEFDFDIKYIKGCTNVVADAWSRRADHIKGLDQEDTGFISSQELAKERERKREEINSMRSELLKAEGQEERREAARKAAMEIHPPAPDLPAPNAQGSIVMPTVRCTADKATGGQCTGITKKGQYCWVHLRTVEGLRIKKSNVPGAGLGLFAAKAYTQGALICKYTGDRIIADFRDNDEIGGPYYLERKLDEATDAARTDCGPGRYANDPRGTNYVANAKFAPNHKHRHMGLRATKHIRTGEEILVPYGPAYWRAYGNQAAPRAVGQGDQEEIKEEELMPPPQPASPRKRRQYYRGGRRRRRVNMLITESHVLNWAKLCNLMDLTSPHSGKKGKRTAIMLHMMNTVEGVDRATIWEKSKKGKRALEKEAVAALTTTLPKLYHTETLPKDPTLVEEIKAAALADPKYQKEINKGPESTFTLHGGLLYNKGKLMIPEGEPLRTKLLHWCHDRPENGHLGRDMTIAEVKNHFYWSGMDAMIARYVNTCNKCQANKGSQLATPGLLMPLPIPAQPWESISLDLIGPLNKTEKGNNAILVVVDRLTKMKHFIATTMEVTSDGLVQLVMDNVVRLHGVPLSIVSDRDPRFTAGFWDSFWKAIKTKLPMSSAYHPQTDGQTERENRTLESILRSCVNWRQTDWDLHLTMAEMAINSKRQSSTGYSPYMLNYGREVLKPLDLALRALKLGGPNPTAEERLKYLAEGLARATHNIAAAQKRQSEYADRDRRAVLYAAGDKVMLSTKHVRIAGQTQEQRRKLFRQWIGPFTIKEVVNANAYKLDLPDHMHIHPTINITYLKPYHEGDAQFPSREEAEDRPPAIVTEDNGAEEFEVECIRDARINRRRGGRKEWLVKWKGWPDHESTWEPKENLEGTDFIEKFEAQAGGAQQEQEQPARRRRRKVRFTV